MLYTRISSERIGVLIGADGVTKDRLQEATGTRIAVDSSTGEVTIDESSATDPVLALKARDIVHAMARGFSEDRAFRLLDEDAYLEVLDIKDFAHSRNRVGQIRALDRDARQDPPPDRGTHGRRRERLRAHGLPNRRIL